MKQFLNPKETAARLTVSTRTLARWRDLDTGPRFIKFPGGAVRYDVADIDAWVDEQLEQKLKK